MKSYVLAKSRGTRRQEHDSTPFLIFGLRGIALQSQRLFAEIQHEISKELFRNLMFDSFYRLRSPRQRVIAERQIKILKILLGREHVEWKQLRELLASLYGSLKNLVKAMIRDMNNLLDLGAIKLARIEEGRLRFSVLSRQLKSRKHNSWKKFANYQRPESLILANRLKGKFLTLLAEGKYT
jgi:hypothetical protein